MGLIDWNQLGSVPRTDISPIIELLHSNALNYSKQQVEAAARAQADEHFRQQMANTAADNVRADKQFQANTTYQNATLEQQKAAHADTMRRQGADAWRGSIDPLSAAAAAGDTQKYDAIIRTLPPLPPPTLGLGDMGAGAPMHQQPQQPQAAEDRPLAPPPFQAAPSENPQIEPQRPGLGLGASDLMSATPTAPAAAPPGMFAGPDGVAARRKAYADKAAAAFKARVGADAEKTPAGHQAFTEAMDMMLSGEWDPSKEDPFKVYQATKRDLEHQANEDKRARIHAAGAAGPGGFNPKIDIANQRALRVLQSDVDRWRKSSGYDKIHGADVEIEKLKEQAMSDNPADQAAALERLVSISRGGSATTSALALFQKHLSGSRGNLETSYKRWVDDGTMGDEQVGNLRGSVGLLEKTIKSELERNRGSFVNKYFRSTAYYPMKGNVEDIYSGLYGDVGYDTQYDPDAPTVVPASGRPSTETRSGRGERQQPAPASAAPGLDASAARAQELLRGRR